MFTVFGKPATAGSKRTIPFRRKDGSLGTRTIDDCKRAPSWRTSVQDAAMAAYDGNVVESPVVLKLVFYRPRPKSHFRTGKHQGELKPGVPIYCTTKPDVTKLTRAVEDALTGIVWRDDSQVVKQQTEKRYTAPGERERVDVEIFAV